VNITNFNFSPEFTKAIEAKQVAVQRVLEAENKLRQIEVEARQAEQQAKGEAAAAVARAKGQQEAARILAEAIKENPEYLRYMYIDKLAKDAKIIIIPEGMPFTLNPLEK
jgi:prohibitin 2